MPVIVRHDPGDGDISALASLAALAGLMQAQAPQAPIAPLGPQGYPRTSGGDVRSGGSRPSGLGSGSLAAQRLQMERDTRMKEIESRAQMEKQAADDAMKRTAIKSGLDQHIMEREYDLRLGEIKEKAKIDASQFKYEYTTKQRQEIARMNNARQAIKSSQRLTPTQKEDALRQIELQQAGIEPSAIPRDPNDPIYPDGQGPMDAWEEYGAVMSWDRSGNKHVLIPPDKQPEFLREKMIMEHQMKLKEERSKYVSDVAKMTDTFGNPISMKQKKQMLRDYDDFVKENAGQPEAERQPAGQPEQEPQQKPWHQQIEETGIQVGETKIPVKVSDAHKNLPPDVGMNLAVFNAIHDKFPKYEQVPPELRPAYKRVLEFVEQYYGRR